MNLISRCRFHMAGAVQHVLHFTVLGMFVAVAGPSFWEVTTFHHSSTVKCTGNLGSFEWCLAVSVPIVFCVVWRCFVVLISCQVRKGSGGKSVVEKCCIKALEK